MSGAIRGLVRDARMIWRAQDDLADLQGHLVETRASLEQRIAKLSVPVRRDWTGPWRLDRTIGRWVRPYRSTITGGYHQPSYVSTLNISGSASVVAASNVTTAYWVVNVHQGPRVELAA